MKRLFIIGAGGHGRVIFDIAKINGYKHIDFLDDSDKKNAIGKVSEFVNYIENSDFIVAIGNNDIRQKVMSELLISGARVVALIHPNATVAEDVSIGVGSVVMAGAVINTGAIVGTGVIINTCSSVDHDCNIGDYSHISVGSHIAGNVNVGECTFVGAGATVINNVEICKGCIIGAGAAVIKNIDIEGVYVGVPAERLRNK